VYRPTGAKPTIDIQHRILRVTYSECLICTCKSIWEVDRPAMRIVDRVHGNVAPCSTGNAGNRYHSIGFSPKRVTQSPKQLRATGSDIPILSNKPRSNDSPYCVRPAESRL
jgi:hypothetical protein